MSKIPDADNVHQTYSGRKNHCCCGCAGKHYTDRSGIRTVLAKMRKLEAEGSEVEVENTYVCIVTERRQYIAYVFHGGAS